MIEAAIALLETTAAAAADGGAVVAADGELSPTHFLIFAVLLTLSALCSGAESALTSLNPIKLQVASSNPTATQALILQLLKDKSRMISALLIGNNIVNAALTTYATVVFTGSFASLGPTLAAALAATASVVFLLLFGEVLPKTVGVNMPMGVSLLVAWPLYCMMIVLSPATWLLSHAQRLMLRLLRHDAEAGAMITSAELSAMAHIAERQDVLAEGQGRAIANLATLHETFVREVLTPRIEVVGLPLASSYTEVIRCFRTHRYSRLPVYAGDIDGIVGVINIRDVLGLSTEEQATFKLSDIARKPIFVPETKRANDLILEMRRDRNHFAVVVDEFGGTAGVVTLEDLLEAVVGHIEDEFDAGAVGIRRIGSSLLLVDASVSLHDLEHALKITLRGVDDVDTAAGLFLREFEEIPEEGDSVTYDKVELVVRRMRGQRIGRLLVQMKDRADETGS